jgi:single-strand DNA-binding protein
MASFNRVILVGNLTRDVDLRYTPSQTAVTDIGLAVNDRVKKNNEWVDETTFVDVTLWGRQAEVANEYLSKGAPVLIEGRLKLDTWEQEGQKRSKLRVVGEKMQMLGGRSGGGSGGGPGGGSRAQSGGQGDYAGAGYGDVPMSGPGDDDVPF